MSKAIDEFENHASTTNQVSVLEFALVSFHLVDKSTVEAMQICDTNAIIANRQLGVLTGKTAMRHYDTVILLSSDGIYTKPQLINSFVGSIGFVD